MSYKVYTGCRFHRKWSGNKNYYTLVLNSEVSSVGIYGGFIQGGNVCTDIQISIQIYIRW